MIQPFGPQIIQLSGCTTCSGFWVIKFHHMWGISSPGSTAPSSIQLIFSLPLAMVSKLCGQNWSSLSWPRQMNKTEGEIDNRCNRSDTSRNTCRAEMTISAERTGESSPSFFFLFSLPSFLFLFFFLMTVKNDSQFPLEEFLCITILVAKKFFVMSNLNCLWFNAVLFHSIHHGKGKSNKCQFHRTTSYTWWQWIRHPEFSSLGLNNSDKNFSEMIFRLGSRDDVSLSKIKSDWSVQILSLLLFFWLY